jgi:hypothetical protein
MDKGQALDWACNALLRVECVVSPAVTFRADVIFVHLNGQDVPVNIEQAVRDIFHVDGNMHLPCWLPASIADNYRHSWKEAGLDRMAVQPDTVKLATTPGEGGSVKARKREGGWEEREERSAARLSPHLCTRRSPPPSPCAPPAPRSRRRASPSSA